MKIVTQGSYVAKQVEIEFMNRSLPKHPEFGLTNVSVIALPSIRDEGGRLIISYSGEADPAGDRKQIVCTAEELVDLVLANQHLSKGH